MTRRSGGWLQFTIEHPTLCGAGTCPTQPPALRTTRHPHADLGSHLAVAMQTLSRPWQTLLSNGTRSLASLRTCTCPTGQARCTLVNERMTNGHMWGPLNQQPEVGGIVDAVR